MEKRNKTVKMLIRDGFFNLLLKKPYGDITITDIINAAGVARVSFYRNYSSIDDIIDDFLNDTVLIFLAEVYPVLSGKDERKWRELLFLIFYRANKDFIPLPSDNLGILISILNAKMQRLNQQIPSETMYDKYTILGKVGLIVNIVKKWYDDGMKETPEEMVNYIMSFILLF